MLPVQTKTFKTYDWTLAAVDGLLTIAYLGLYSLEALGHDQIGVSAYVIFLGGLHVVYLLSIYPQLRRRSVIGSSLIGALLLSSNLALIILASGGFRSPFYALWLILILGIGIYKPSMPLGAVGVSTVYFIGHVLSRSADSAGIAATAIALGAAYITGALGFWLWHSQHTKFKAAQSLSEVTDQLTAEQIKSEVLIDQVGEGVVAIDSSRRITLLNPAAVKLTGWPAAEARGLDEQLVLALSDESGQPLDGDQDIFHQAIDKRDIISRDDVVLKTRSNKKLSLSITVSPVLASDRLPSGAIAVFRDISQSKLAERQRNEFISTASHEMRTPVAAVEGYIALALNPKVANVDETARKYLQKAQTSTQHLGQLFQDLLAITRIEEGRLPNHPEVIDLNRLIEQVVDELRFKAQKKSLKLMSGASSQNPATKSLNPLYYVYADPERVREVLINLADNAIKFTAQGSVEITLEGREDEVVLGIKDTGPGIAPEDVDHLFQKFYRIENKATAGVGGTGLGLYISRAIVEMYQGRIWVETAPGKGSHFRFSLPRLSYDKAQQLLSAQSPAQPTATPNLPAAKT